MFCGLSRDPGEDEEPGFMLLSVVKAFDLDSATPFFLN